MSSDSNKILDILPDGMRVMSEDIGFAAGDLSPCPKCTRPNSPTRGECIYCGEMLSRSELADAARIDGEFLEPWENGFNVAYDSRTGKLPENAIAELSHLLRVEPRALESVFEQKALLPIGRLRNEDAAQRFIEGLSEFGVSGVLIPDAALAVDKPPVRLRSIEFEGESCTFVDFNTNERIMVPHADVRLVVMGAKIESRTETTWKKKRGSREVVDEALLDSDQPLIDIYRATHDLGFRVQVNGFDFSALGPAKSLIATENVKLLAVRLGDISGLVDQTYLRSRLLLDQAWELETETDHFGPLRAGFEKSKKTKISIVNNLRQFTKYSRLQRLSI